MDLYALHEKMTGHLFPAYSNSDERFLALALCGEAAELEALFAKVKPGRYNSLAITSLEQSLMWIVKELTS